MTIESLLAEAGPRMHITSTTSIRRYVHALRKAQPARAVDRTRAGVYYRAALPTMYTNDELTRLNERRRGLQPSLLPRWPELRHNVVKLGDETF